MAMRLTLDILRTLRECWLDRRVRGHHRLNDRRAPIIVRVADDLVHPTAFDDALNEHERHDADPPQAPRAPMSAIVTSVSRVFVTRARTRGRVRRTRTTVAPSRSRSTRVRCRDSSGGRRASPDAGSRSGTRNCGCTRDGFVGIRAILPCNCSRGCARRSRLQLASTHSDIPADAGTVSGAWRDGIGRTRHPPLLFKGQTLGKAYASSPPR